MAKVKKVKTGRRQEEATFSKNNWIVLGAGLVTIILGFISLGVGSTTIAPILLVLGYCVLMPIGIMINKDKKRKTEGG